MDGGGGGFIHSAGGRKMSATAVIVLERVTVLCGTGVPPVTLTGETALLQALC